MDELSAAAELKNGNLGLVLMDIMMPEMDGITAIDCIAKPLDVDKLLSLVRVCMAKS